MPIVSTNEQLKDTFAELVATNVYNNVHSVTYQNVLDYIKRNCETLMKSTVSIALRMYTSSYDYVEDVDLLKELQQRMEKFTEG